MIQTSNARDNTKRILQAVARELAHHPQDLDVGRAVSLAERAAKPVLEAGSRPSLANVASGEVPISRLPSASETDEAEMGASPRYRPSNTTENGRPLQASSAYA